MITDCEDIRGTMLTLVKFEYSDLIVEVPSNIKCHHVFWALVTKISKNVVQILMNIFIPKHQVKWFVFEISVRVEVLKITFDKYLSCLYSILPTTAVDVLIIFFSCEDKTFSVFFRLYEHHMDYVLLKMLLSGNFVQGEIVLSGVIIFVFLDFYEMVNQVEYSLITFAQSSRCG